MSVPHIDLTQLPVASQLDWRIEFGLYLRNTASQRRKDRAHLTLDAYESDVDLMAEWFAERFGVPFEPVQMNQVNVKEYFNEVECKWKPNTHNRKVASVRMLVKWARQSNLIDHDPTERIPFVDATRESPRDLNDEERKQLEAVAEAGESTLLGLRDSLIFFLMNDAGLRISEAVELLLSDLHLDEGYIHVFGKGKKHRKVKIGSKLINKMRLWLDRKPDSIEGTFITDEHGLAIGRQQGWKRFVLIRTVANVIATPHAMRHTYVIRYMHAYMKGDPWLLPAAIDAVCQQTGDKPEVILAYYTRARESSMRAAAELL